MEKRFRIRNNINKVKRSLKSNVKRIFSLVWVLNNIFFSCGCLALELNESVKIISGWEE